MSNRYASPANSISIGKLALGGPYRSRSNHVHVLPYLNDVLVRLPRIVPEYLRVGNAETPFDSLLMDQREQLFELLPDRWLKAHPEHRTEDRQRELDQANQRRHQRRAIRRRAVKV